MVLAYRHNVPYAVSMNITMHYLYNRSALCDTETGETKVNKIAATTCPKCLLAFAAMPVSYQGRSHTEEEMHAYYGDKWPDVKDTERKRLMMWVSEAAKLYDSDGMLKPTKLYKPPVE